jgi:hypothetical protein
MIRAIGPLELDLLPQAILARPIFFFTWSYHEGWDDLDYFEEGSFSLNNELQFCLRHYRNQPGRMVTLYLEQTIMDVSQIRGLSDEIAREFQLPDTAVRWRRGDPLEFGTLPVKDDRLREAEARVLALKIASREPNHEASTSLIKERLPDYRDLSPTDLERSPTRPNEQKWQQVVGNVISHRESGTSIFSKGYAVRTADGIRVTDLGLNYLTDMGFSPKRVYSRA